MPPAARKRNPRFANVGHAFMLVISKQLVAGDPQKVVVRELLREVRSQVGSDGRLRLNTVDGLFCLL